MDELTAAQQTILAPLSDRWDALLAAQRKRILSTAKQYSKMTNACRAYSAKDVDDTARDLVRELIEQKDL